MTVVHFHLLETSLLKPLSYRLDRLRIVVSWGDHVERVQNRPFAQERLGKRKDPTIIWD